MRVNGTPRRSEEVEMQVAPPTRIAAAAAKCLVDEQVPTIPITLYTPARRQLFSIIIFTLSA